MLVSVIVATFLAHGPTVPDTDRVAGARASLDSLQSTLAKTVDVAHAAGDVCVSRALAPVVRLLEQVQGTDVQSDPRSLYEALTAAAALMTQVDACHHPPMTIPAGGIVELQVDARALWDPYGEKPGFFFDVSRALVDQKDWPLDVAPDPVRDVLRVLPGPAPAQ